MSLYEFLLFVHVLSAAVWVGGAVMLRVQAARAESAADMGTAAAMAKETERLGSTVLMPASITLLVSGLWMAFDVWDGLEPLWIKLGLAIYVVSAVMGAAFLGPQYKKVGELRAAGGGPELDERIRRISLVSWIDMALLVAAIFVMTVKPG
ncbi:MAG: DUF2269 domain-containing protein [Actinomycetota bacterium]|nr:DUF2269 domain-containing protein [Actinomycetota bacterium]